MSASEVFEKAVSCCETLPTEVRGNASQAFDIEEGEFDESYLEFLDTQIRLCPRGKDWNERLKRRREAMAPYCGRTYLGGRVEIDGRDYWIKVDAETGHIFHWEFYSNDEAP